MTKEGQTYYWRTFDDKTGTAAIIVPAPPVQTAAVTQPSVPDARVIRDPQPASAKPTAPTQAPRPVPKPVARPEAAKPAAAPGAPEKVPTKRAVSSQITSLKAPSSQAPSSQAPSSQADSVARARLRSAAPAATSAFTVVNVAPGDVLNVRKGPSAQFEVVGGLPPGSRGVTVTGACQLRWCPVEHPSARGWVNSTFLAREEPPGAGTNASAGRTGRAGATN
jgi:uncharacterized protein YraI